MWEVFTLGYMPYPGRGNQEVMEVVADGGRLESPYGCPSPVYAIMTSCWIAAAADRPSFTTVVTRLQTSLDVSEELLYLQFVHITYLSLPKSNLSGDIHRKLKSIYL
jgi:hypothetical protein